MSLQLIRKYYNEVDKIIQYGGSSSEVVISQKFGDLINEYAKKRELMLIPQLSYKIDGKTIRPDGTLKNNCIVYGFWESKANVNLEEEIRKKFNAGYPKSNILFEDSKIAVLYQEGEAVKYAKIHDEKELDAILTQFVSFENPEVKSFNAAVEQFKKDIPVVLLYLREMIINQEKANPEFVNERNVFHTICKQSINPDISIENINEMLIQHILTEEIFMSVFSDNQLISENNIARELYKIESTFFTGSTKRHTLDSIKNYYERIKHAASAIDDHHEKQTFLKVIYENFYKAYNPKGADRLGVVYTPNEIVKFQIESTDYLLLKHFGKGLADRNVEILDPATGTGTYICDLIEFIPKQYLEYKYKNEIHANEVAILPYYIANLNIEYTFRQKMGYYHEFKNICFVDTLDNIAALGYEGKMGNIYGYSHENADRIKQQNERKISVVIGNPPYNTNQMNENDNNKNRSYFIASGGGVDNRIKDTYIKNSTAQKTKVYDMYARFFRWASDRIVDNGAICFVTNNSLVNARTFDGFRKSIQEEFDYAYIIDLGGNIRELSGKDGIWLNEEHTIFGMSAAVGICITYLVKISGKEKRNCRINYLHPCDIRATREEKFNWLYDNKFENIPFELIIPDERNNWIELPDNDFDTLLPLADKDVKLGRKKEAIFDLYSLGTISNRDEWVYDVDKNNLTKKINHFIEKYNNDVKELKGKINEKNVTEFITREIKYTRDVKKDLLNQKKYLLKKTDFRICRYRPFVKQNLYFAEELNEMRYQMPFIFPKNTTENILITFNSNAKYFDILVSDTLVDLHFLGDSQCLPLYRFDKSGNRIENITDWGLQQFRENYELKIMNYEFENEEDKKQFIIHNSKFIIQKEDIFHYVYAVLHNPTYRKKYELNLKRDFPRIPFYTDFWQWAAWGKQLIDLHVNYETIEPFPLKVKNLPDYKNLADFKPKAKLKANKADGEIILDELTALQGVPPEAWEYKLGIRSAMEWILDQYRESIPTDATIREKFNTYKFVDYKDHVIDLLQRVCTVSVRTVQIMSEMEKMGE